ncbi:MAG TPA: FHA domain-containing protein [Anaerolineaceae bacterium]|nr:FHA domain-containing protein [Anaerolineaceae bacterium]HPN52367.1 FHA domain-containing protein [Anaerolineaceae bacterium]
MSRINHIQIFDKDGWRKEIPIEKDIVYIGSDPRCDVHLSPTRGGGVAPTHAQIIASQPATNPKIINLAPDPIFVGAESTSAVATLGVIDLTDGVSCRVGEFTLTFSLSSSFSNASSQSSDHIGLSISLPRTRLDPHKTIEGYITIINHGEQNSVQVALDLDGLPSACYDIEPCPIMFANSEKEVRLRIYHRGSLPLAGDHNITIRANAEKAYPGEEATIVRTIQVQPFFRHRLTVLDPSRPVSPHNPVDMISPSAAGSATGPVPSSSQLTQVPLDAVKIEPVLPAADIAAPSAQSSTNPPVHESQSWWVSEPSSAVTPQVLKMKAEAAASEPEIESSTPSLASRTDWWAEVDDPDSSKP